MFFYFQSLCIIELKVFLHEIVKVEDRKKECKVMFEATPLKDAEFTHERITDQS